MRPIIYCCLLLLSACTNRISEKTLIAIQPIGIVEPSRIEAAKEALIKQYGARVIVLDSIAPPPQAFVNIKVPRYRADVLIAYLKNNKPDSIDYVIGLTNYDISVSKKDALGNYKKPESRYKDFGIFGLGYKPGVSCIVSTYRLGNIKSPKAFARLAKVSTHEIRHNLGLDHCTEPRCVMADAVEKMNTVDNAAQTLCAQCSRKVLHH